MSLFWQHFTDNGQVQRRAIAEFRESLADLCEGFALRGNLPRWQRRQTLLAELKRLADYYRRSDCWEDVD